MDNKRVDLRIIWNSSKMQTEHILLLILTSVSLNEKKNSSAFLIPLMDRMRIKTRKIHFKA